MNIEDELKDIKGTLKKIDEAIRGNGKPGIQLRLDRVESKVSIVSRLVWLVIGAVIVVLAKGYFG